VTLQVVGVFACTVIFLKLQDKKFYPHATNENKKKSNSTYLTFLSGYPKPKFILLFGLSVIELE